MARTWPRGLGNRLCYGGDYNPEQWPESVWDEDVSLMRGAGVNLVSVGVFAWSMLEPQEGRYAFDRLDRIMDRLHRGGIAVALATPTASPPPWFSFAHPDALPLTAEGVRLGHGSRDTYCACAPAYRAASLGIATALARRYADHPALALWHVHNEYGTICHCDHVAGAFRSWLRERYGTLDQLNQAWTTDFWSQRYGEWEHVLPPRATQYLPNPAQRLDFRRFWSDTLLDCFREQRDALRDLTPDVPITTNFVLGGWVPVDQWRWADAVDLVAIDHYPSGVDTCNEETAFAADLARGWAGRRPWLLMEQAPNLIYAGGRMVPKPPGLMTRLSLSHVARGSAGAMFFQWRAPRGGSEMFHSAMVPHAGPSTRTFAEVCALGARLAQMKVTDSPVVADLALIWDPECWWALQGAGLPGDLDYLAAVREWHAAALGLGLTVDVLSPRGDPRPYALVLAPALFLVGESTAAILESYVEDGGSLVVGPFSGVVDRDHRVWPYGYPGPLRDLLGVRVTELHPHDHVALSHFGSGRRWAEKVELVTASAQSTYEDGPLVGEPAVTRHGRAWYVSTCLADPTQMLAHLCAEAGIAAPEGAGTGVEVVRRADGTTFVIDHRTGEVSCVNT